MDRRDFLIGSGAAGAFALAGCSSASAVELYLPEPLQVDREPWEIAPGILGLATFSARVLVLSRKDYPEREDDTLSAVSPTDLAVAWGLAAQSEAREAVELWQVNRRYVWRARQSDMDKPGVRDFTRMSGNWHMVPADADIAYFLQRVRKGDIVRILGDLVKITFDNGIYFKSSLTRDDTGDGACEIIRARSIVVER